MSDVYDPYCVYCDEDESGDHAECESRWDQAQQGGSGLLPTPPAPSRDGEPRANPSLGFF